MGLDIRAFNGLKRCDTNEEEYYKIHNCVNLLPNDILFNQSSGLSGYYTHNGEYFIFRAGSYSSYSRWRSILCIMMGYPTLDGLFESASRDFAINNILDDKVKAEPFIELICFSDCEGIIGPEVSHKLYLDFISYKEKAMQYTMSNKAYDWFSLYEDFTKAFKIASNNGCVEFC